MARRGSGETPKLSPKRVTLRDLARELGLSDRAVSAALNPEETKVKLKSETLERIRNLAAERNYLPDTSARSMRSGRFFNIGYFEACFSPVHYPLLGAEAGVCDVATERGYRVVLIKLPTDLAPEHNVIPSVFREAHLDGLIVSHLGNLPEKYKQAIDSSTFPIVYFNEKQKKNAVYVDDVSAARELTHYLIGRGYRKIVFVTIEGDTTHYSLTDRGQGYREAMLATGLRPQFSGCSGQDWKIGLAGCIAASPAAEAFLCGDDLTAIRVFKALYRSGRRVPDDVAIAGFGDGESPMELTCMRIPYYNMARIAVEMCMELIRDRKVATRPAQIVKAELVAGETA